MTLLHLSIVKNWIDFRILKAVIFILNDKFSIDIEHLLKVSGNRYYNEKYYTDGNTESMKLNVLYLFNNNKKS